MITSGTQMWATWDDMRVEAETPENISQEGNLG
jgi:hypothetical protein